MGNQTRRGDALIWRIVAKTLHFAAAGMSLMLATNVAAKDRQTTIAPAMQKLIACRDIADDSARLRCFDATAASVASAVESKQVVVVDREQIEAERRATFGARRAARDLPVPAGEDASKLSSIEGRLRAADQGQDGWVLILEDGSVWRQTDGLPLALPPRPGDAVTVRRAAMGTFKLSIRKQPAIRVRRIA